MDLVHHHILDANSQQYRLPQSAFLNFLPPPQKKGTWQLDFCIGWCIFGVSQQERLDKWYTERTAEKQSHVLYIVFA
jgi:hypothetical protein